METGTIDAVLDAMIQKSREANPEQPDDYLNENGLLICGRCGTPKEAMIPFPDGKLRKVRVACTCKRKAHEKEQEELRRMEVQRRIRELRRQGIGDTVARHGRLQTTGDTTRSRCGFASGMWSNGRK